MVKQGVPCSHIERVKSDTELRSVTSVITDKRSLILWQIPLPLLFFDRKSGQEKHLLAPPIIHSHCPREDYRLFHLGVCLNLGFSESKP